MKPLTHRAKAKLEQTGNLKPSRLEQRAEADCCIKSVTGEMDS